MDGLGTAGGGSAFASLSRPPLDAGALRRALVTADSMWTALTVVPDVGSTNDALAQEAHNGGESGRILLAEYQSAGHGRLDRTWTAPPRSSVAMSVLVRPDVPVRWWPWIPLLTGLAVAAACRRVADVPATLKWPNDVLVEGQKLAGILVQRVEDPTPAAVIGIGLNVSQTRAELPGPEAVSLVLAGATSTDRSLLVRTALRGLENLLAGWIRRGGEATDDFVGAYVDACSTIGQRVRVELPGASVMHGEAVGVDRRGRLLVRRDEGGAPVPVSAGDVVHVRTTSA